MSKGNKKLESIKKSSKVAMILARIAMIICIVGASICVCVGIYLIAFNSSVNEELLRAVTEGKLDLDELTSELGRNGFALPFDDLDKISGTLGLNLLLTGIVVALFAVVFHFVGRVFKDIQESDSPFRQSILKSMRVVFVLVTLLVLQSSVLIGVLVGFSLWCVYCVFGYGCELQQLSDETL